MPLPLGLSLVNSSFAMPLCEPAAFYSLWQRIREALPDGGRFSGQWYGPRDSWVGRPGMTFVSRDEALAMLDGLELEMFEEEEADGVTPRGNAKHWHIFHIVARKLLGWPGVPDAAGPAADRRPVGRSPMFTARPRCARLTAPSTLKGGDPVNLTIATLAIVAVPATGIVPVLAQCCR